MSDIINQINILLEQTKTTLDNLVDEVKKKKLMKEYNSLYRSFNFPSQRTDYNKLLTEVEKLLKKIVMPPVSPRNEKKVIEVEEKKPLQFGGFIPQEQVPKITPATPQQKEALLYTGEVNEDDIDKYGIVGNYDADYYQGWWVKQGENYINKDILFEVAEYEAEYYNYYNNTYTSKQIAKTYNRIAESFIIQNCNTHCDGQIIIKYLKFIQLNPQYALPTLLWIDTFHDFKEERLFINIDKKKKNLNDIIDYLCYRIYGRHWGNLQEKGAIKDCVNIGHTYNFDKMYQNSFFNFDNNVKVTGFHPDVIHTVLRPLVENPFFNGQYSIIDVATLLYDVSNVFIHTVGGWESPFLYAYLMYNFNFDMNKDGLIQNLRDVFWNEIKGDKEDYSIPYYAKDVDKGSSNFFKGTNIILPASLFDANRSNSSQNIKDFVPITNTIIPLCNGYDFEYKYKPENCNLQLDYSSDNKSYTLCDVTSGFNNSSCINANKPKDYPDNMQDFINILSPFKKQQKETLLDPLDNNIKTLLKIIEADNLYTNNIPNNIGVALTSVRDSVSNTYFGGKGCVNIPNGQGMSPNDCVTVVIGLLIDVLSTKKPTHNELSPISCKILDFWVALKRIGDFGQIMQCKQLGIPLFTTDNMQLLISIAACSSAVWTEDNAKVLWYDSHKDAILCNGLNPNNRTICHKNRFIYNDSNYRIQRVLQILQDLPTEDTYSNLESSWKFKNNLTGISVSDYLIEFYTGIINTIKIAIKDSGEKNDIKVYIYLKIQEQILINTNSKYPNSNFLIKLNNLQPRLNLPADLQAQLQGQIQPQLNQLQTRLQAKIQQNPPLNYIVNRQLKFTLDFPSNFIKQEDRESMLQVASSNIENDYVEKLSDLNDIRNGCVINRSQNL